MQKKIITCIYFSFILLNLSAQSIPVVSLSFDEDIRTLQLKGKFSPNYSLAVRPVYFTKKFTPDSFYLNLAAKNEQAIKEKAIHFLGKFGKLSLLPVSIFSKFNSHHPYGWNDGAMFSTKGLQSIASAGIFFELGPLAMQLKPEYIYAGNETYETAPKYGPTKFGKYEKYFWGQSSVRLNGGPVSVGISSENVWWGPGQFSSLMLSNNAPGFLHLTFNSRKPLNTPIGHLEWQVISGRLESEKDLDLPMENRNLKSFYDVYGSNSRYKGDWNYLNAFNLIYQPRFLKGIFIGFSRSFTGESKIVFDKKRNATFVNQYLPILSKFFKSKLVKEDAKGWNQLANIYIRALLPKSHAEFYFEYGWNDHSYNERDFIMSPFHSSSYIAGAKKSVEIKDDVWLNFSGEVVNMEQSPDYSVRWAGSWYSHSQGTGYSNLNQILGVGAGFGSNAQVFSTTLNKGYKKIGVLFERVQREPNTNTVRWNDYSYGITGQQKLHDILLTWRLSGVSSKNYTWMQDKNKFNFLGMLSLNYFW